MFRTMSAVTGYARVRALWVGLIGLSLFGCVRQYQPPKPNEPHAILKLRRTYEKTAGAELSESALVGEFQAFSNYSASEMAATPRSDAILVHPVPAELTVSSRFLHREVRRVMEHYHEQVPYQASENYDCGTAKSHRTCTRFVRRHRSESKTRWVNKTITVDDGSCEGKLRLAPKQGATYLLQYTYQDRSLCALSCFEQKPGPDGTMNQTPCGS